jgi:chromosome segregation ATPase
MFKSKLTNNVRLQAAIDQCEAALDDQQNSVDRNLASVQKDLRSLRREFEKAKDSGDSPKLKAQKLKKLVEKRDLLKLKVQALEGEVERFRAQTKKQRTNFDQVIHEKHERMHGLLAYAMGTGGLNSDGQLLFHTLGDFLQAKNESDRASAERAVNLILVHGDVFGDKAKTTETEDDRIIAEFEAITDPAEQNRFYAKHSAEIKAALGARKNNQS